MSTPHHRGTWNNRFQSFSDTARRLTRFRIGLAGLVIVVVFISMGIVADILAPYGENEQSYDIYRAPTSQHWLGTDSLGRDNLSRIIYGSRVSIAFGFGVAMISLGIGVILGSIPAYFGGFVDDVFSRLFELVLMIPNFFLIIVAVALFGSNIQTTMLIVALTVWPSNARIARAQVLTLKTRAYVQASVVTGTSHLRILFKHILPNGIHPVIANSALQMANAILLEASLSFLGLGDPNHVSWGGIILDSLRNFSAWWLSVAGIALMVLTLGFNLVADGISHMLSPRLELRK